MPNYKNLQYVNVDAASLNRSPEVKKAYVLVGQALSLLEEAPDDKIYVPVLYGYCPNNLFFFRVIGTVDAIYIEGLPINLVVFVNLYENYTRYFVAFDAVSNQSFGPENMNVIKALWWEIYAAFIPPLEIADGNGKPVNILISFLPILDKTYLFDFSAIFDLQYFFLPIADNKHIYAISIAGSGILQYIRNLPVLFKPIAEKTIILNGFDKFYDEELLDTLTEMPRALAKTRETLYQQMLANAKNAGATVTDLCFQDDLWNSFHPRYQGWFIQLLGHYAYNEHNPAKSRLYFQRSSLRFDIFEAKLTELKNNNALRNDLEIDAVTCTNFFSFRKFYDLGVKYIYMSHHELDTDQAAFVLNELYTGVNARRIGWEPHYLNGNNHFYEARSNVYRCFFTLSRNQEHILTP